jgi:hypothetical protein
MRLSLVVSAVTTRDVAKNAAILTTSSGAIDAKVEQGRREEVVRAGRGDDR